MERDREHRRVIRMLFGALVIVFGLQSMRFLFGSLSWYLRDTLGIGVLDLIPIALAPFLVGALFPVLARVVGFRFVLALAAGVLAAARVGGQIATDPAADFWFAAIATAAFVGLLPLLLGLGRSTLAGGVLLGIAIDTAIKSLGLSLDLAYATGLAPIIAVFALAIAMVWAYSELGGVTIRGVGWRSGLPLLGLAPFLFAQLLILQNQGWTAAVIGGSTEVAQLRIVVLNAVALYVAYRFAGNRVMFVLATAVVAMTLMFAEGPSGAFNLLAALAIPAAAVVWAGMVPEPEHERIGASGFYLVTGAVLLLALGLAYYVPLDMNLGFDAPAVRYFALVLLVLAAVAALNQMPSVAPVERADWLLAAFAAPLALASLILPSADLPIEESTESVRFVSYNIHSAYNVEGVFDVGAIADVIRDTRADVVALQEVPRGRLLSANTDILSLLVADLGYEHVAFFGTTDPVWGNAVLSRYPIVGVDQEYLPRVGTPMRRGYLGATVDIDGTQVLVISTHLQHLNDPDVHERDPEGDLLPVHREQIGVILEDWGGYRPAVLLGDFNARPGWEQIELVTSSGWIDVWTEAGTGDGFTSNAANPMHRIDYIFHTEDVTATDAGVIRSTASDHFAVVADLVFE